MELRTPSLSQTREDIPLLAEHFLKRFRYIRMVSGISAEAMKALITCSWPGNVRQFANAVEHALVFGRSEFIEPEDLPNSVTERKSSNAAGSFDARVHDLKRTLVEGAVVDAAGDFEVAAGTCEGGLSRFFSGLWRKLGATARRKVTHRSEK